VQLLGIVPDLELPNLSSLPMSAPAAE